MKWNESKPKFLTLHIFVLEGYLRFWVIGTLDSEDETSNFTNFNARDLIEKLLDKDEN